MRDNKKPMLDTGYSMLDKPKSRCWMLDEEMGYLYFFIRHPVSSIPYLFLSSIQYPVSLANLKNTGQNLYLSHRSSHVLY
jgi:hypothetical protein